MSDDCAQVQPLEEWVDGGSAADCRTCQIGLMVPWYRDALKSQGLGAEAQSLEEIAERGDPVQVARALDAVKGRVPPELSKTLHGYDCAVQQKEDLP